MSFASSKASSARRQRGLSLFGMLFWAVAVAMVGLLLLRVYPSVQKYITTRQSVDKVMRAEPRPNSVPGIRNAFNRQRDIEYIQDMIKGEDLEIEAQGDTFRVGFAYDDEVELVGPVFLLIKYRYSTGGH
ncbi:DUF4845 domain-containing protein [Ideonella sp. DXS29W]|uniref:DUF4845 domain-containing protein n=1 Tax=Ideonella lacteola TaxID=2984193 RepID=A0ABU9BQS2_9BURK